MANSLPGISSMSWFSLASGVQLMSIAYRSDFCQSLACTVEGHVDFDMRFVFELFLIVKRWIWSCRSVVDFQTGFRFGITSRTALVHHT